MHSKMDRLQKRDKLSIARTGNTTCYVVMLESYVARTRTQLL